MKVLVVANMFPSKRFPTYGTFIRNFCNQLDEIGVHHDRVVMHKQTNTLKKVLSYVSFYVSSFGHTLFGNYDAIYVHYPSYSALGVLFANKIKKRPLYVNVHGSDVFPTNEKQKKLEINTCRAIRKADKVVVPSEYFKRVVIDKYKYPEEQIRVYPSGGVDLEVFYPFDTEKIKILRKKMGLDPNKVTVGYISRLYRLKGWDTFVNAVEKLSNYCDRAQFVMVGSGPDEDELNSTLAEKHLENVIHRFPAQPQEELANYYNVLDVFVFAAAAAESLGLVAIEAMACGVPVFASDYAAPKYYVEDGKNGYKFPLRDDKTLADRIVQILNDQEELKLLESGAKKTAEEYGTERIKSILKEIMTV